MLLIQPLNWAGLNRTPLVSQPGAKFTGAPPSPRKRTKLQYQPWLVPYCALVFDMMSAAAL